MPKRMTRRNISQGRTLMMLVSGINLTTNQYY